VPDPPQPAAVLPKSKDRHRLAAGVLVHVNSVLCGLHHEYSLATRDSFGKEPAGTGTAV
jgi:hypothetical protein